MQQSFVEVNGVRTKILTFGSIVKEDGPAEDMILMIPGNPGITRFYTMFLQTIYEQVHIPIWVIGHVGHDLPPKWLKGKNNGGDFPALKGNESLYGLQGQVEHKIEAIKANIPPTTRIHLIGHSIGAYIILKLLKDPTINSRITASYLLFPTIEYMAETRNGKFITKFVAYIVRLLIFLAFIFSHLPSFLQNFLLYVYFRVNCVPRMHTKSVIDLIDPGVLEKVFFMGLEEMELVKERDNDVIRNNLKKLKFYYGATDGWAPVSYFSKLKEEIPDVDAEVCTRKFDHAFVLKSSRDMGRMVSEWIQEKL